MNTPLESIRAQGDYSPETAQALDRNIRKLARTYGPHAVTRDYTFRDDDTIDSLHVDATAGNITITLPPPTGNRRRRVIKTDASTNTVTLSAGGTLLINNAITAVMHLQYRFVEVEPSGTQWYITTFGFIYTRPEGDDFLGLPSLATTATAGFIYIPSCAGVPTGVPALIGNGRVPLVVDSTNNKLYFYSSGAWRDAGP